MDFGKVLMLVGGAIFSIGLLIKLAPWLLNWFGKLPGDIRFQSSNSFVFIPITTMIIVSLLITLIINLFFRR